MSVASPISTWLSSGYATSGVEQTVFSGSLVIAVPVAMAAGLVSFQSPCVLPLVPGYLSYITGLSGADLAAPRRGRVPPARGEGRSGSRRRAARSPAPGGDLRARMYPVHRANVGGGADPRAHRGQCCPRDDTVGCVRTGSGRAVRRGRARYTPRHGCADLGAHPPAGCHPRWGRLSGGHGDPSRFRPPDPADDLPAGLGFRVRARAVNNPWAMAGTCSFRLTRSSW